MTVTITEFLTSFPEFLSTDGARVTEYLDQVQIEACYDTFLEPAVTKLAIKLHTAHILAIYGMENNGLGLPGQKVKSLKTKHDEIQYSGGDEGLYGWDRTSYGTRLQALIVRNQVGFYWCA